MLRQRMMDERSASSLNDHQLTGTLKERSGSPVTWGFQGQRPADLLLPPAGAAEEGFRTR